MTRWDWLLEALKFVLGALMILDLAACSSEAGWQFQIGVSPVTQIDSRQQHDIGKARIREAKY